MALNTSLDNYSGSTQVLNEFEVDYNTRYFLMSADKWALVGVLNQNGSDIWNSVPACRQDDHIIFNLDGTWELSEGDDVCNPSFEGKGTYTNTKFSIYPPSYSFVTSNLSGDWTISDNQITVVDESHIECLVNVGVGTQTYKFERQ